jgi:hypothetical protein
MRPAIAAITTTGRSVSCAANDLTYGSHGIPAKVHPPLRIVSGGPIIVKIKQQAERRAIAPRHQLTPTRYHKEK